MSKELHINTILAQAGIKSDKATGALVTPLHFSTTYQHPEFGKPTGKTLKASTIADIPELVARA